MKDEEIDFFNEIDTYSIELINNFNKLCDRAKQYILSFLLNAPSEFMEVHIEQVLYDLCYSDVFDKNLTPIEQIFGVVFVMYLSSNSFIESNNLIVKCTEYSVKGKLIISAAILEATQSQAEIKYNDKSYRADFVVDFSRLNTKGNIMFPEINNLKYVIEIDGFNYHSKKEQMNYDYERENNLKELGYTVIRFTGSQVYNKPYTCVKKIFDIIKNDVKCELNKKQGE